MRGDRPWRRRYGLGEHQFGDLRLTDTGTDRRPLIIIHGGFWRTRRSLDMTAPIAIELARRGWVTWNIEYRRNGQGPWSATLDDCSAAVDHLAELGAEFGFDATTPILVGHSAGGQLALWCAGRGAVASGACGPAPIVDARDVIAVAAVTDFELAVRAGTGDGAVAEFVGGGPDEFPDRYLAAAPIGRLPTGGRSSCLHSHADSRVPFEQSEQYVDAARSAGDDAELIEIDGDHTAAIEVGSAAWHTLVTTIESFETRR